MLRPGSLALTLLLAMLTGLGPLSVDMYLASLPSIGRLLDAPTSQVQLTISAYLVGFAIAQVFYGPLSDRHGRRPVLLVALGIYLAGDARLRDGVFHRDADRRALSSRRWAARARACWRAPWCATCTRAPASAASLPRMAAIMALAPLVAPLIGGVLQTVFGWRSNFVVLFCFGAAAWIMVWFLLPETLRQRAPEPVSIASTLRSYRRFLADRGFVIHLGIATCCLCGLFAWISSAAFVLQDIYGLSAAGVRPGVRGRIVGLHGGHHDRGAFCHALGRRPDDGLRHRRDGARRVGDGRCCWRSRRMARSA